MSKQIFFTSNVDLPHEYIKYVALQFASQIGTANLATLGITSIEFDAAELDGMRGPGFIVHFSASAHGCNAVAVVLYCDLYQVASGNVSRENGRVYFGVDLLIGYFGSRHRLDEFFNRLPEKINPFSVQKHIIRPSD